MNKIDIVIVDDHSIFREGLEFVLNQIESFNVIALCSNGKEYLELVKNIKPDITLMDISMPEMDGPTATELAIEHNPDLKIIALSTYEQDNYYYKMITAGVTGFVQKKADKSTLENAIKKVYNGENFFPQNILRKVILNMGHNNKQGAGGGEIEISKREKEILMLICQGFSNKEIADKLNLSPKTVDNHRTSLLSKTNAKNSANLVMTAIKQGLIKI